MHPIINILLLVASVVIPAAILTCAQACSSTPMPKGCKTDKKEIPAAKSFGKIESVACFYGPMPTGVTVSQDGRIFVNFPRWGDKVDFTVAEIKDGDTVAYPNPEINRPDPNKPSESLISVQSVVVDAKNRLWILDTGRIEWGPPADGGPKLVGVDLRDNKVFKKIPIPSNVALRQTYLNDVRFDLRRGDGGIAYITDSSGETPGIIVVDLASGKSWRRLTKHPSTMPLPDFVSLVEGQPLMRRPPGGTPSPLLVGADGIAISSDGRRLYYCPLSSWSLYSVSTDALLDQSLSDEQVARTVEDEGSKVASDGLESDANNNLYVTSYDHNAILRRNPDNSYDTLACDPCVLWPDTLSVAADGYLYFTANQLHRQAQFHEGKDLREKPYMLFRVRIDAKPVLLK
jgi:sugar lactone lactonase YvrE